MADQATPTDRDCIVAAILIAPSLEPGQSAEFKVNKFRDVLKELIKRGGTSQMAFDLRSEG
jgi:hypothetical protein